MRKNKKFSISGIQPKLLLNIQDDTLEVTESDGTHILKVSPEEYPFAAENEHLTMEIFRLMKLDTAKCGLMGLKDGELAYISKRLDRDQGRKIHQEDMMQSMGIANQDNSKYESKSYEAVGLYLFSIAKNLVIMGDFFKRVVLNFLVGNDDYHLKNISIHPELVGAYLNCLTPIYDSLNTDIYSQGKSLSGEMAMGLLESESGFSEAFEVYGHHSNLCFNAFALRIGLNKKFAESFYESYRKAYPKITDLVGSSFLPEEYKVNYLKTLDNRLKKISIAV